MVLEYKSQLYDKSIEGHLSFSEMLIFPSMKITMSKVLIKNTLM